MGAHSVRKSGGEPSRSLTGSLARLRLSADQLRAVALELSRSERVAAEELQTWNAFATHLLEVDRRIHDAQIAASLTDSERDPLGIRGHGGMLITADAGYIAVLSRRMDRHCRLARILVSPSPMLEASTA